MIARYILSLYTIQQQHQQHQKSSHVTRNQVTWRSYHLSSECKHLEQSSCYERRHSWTIKSSVRDCTHLTRNMTKIKIITICAISTILNCMQYWGSSSLPLLPGPRWQIVALSVMGKIDSVVLMFIMIVKFINVLALKTLILQISMKCLAV